MGALDPQGIYIYDDTENWSPQDDYQNLGQNSVSNAIADVRAEIADLELLADSGWVPITTLNTGWTAMPGHPPRVRKVGDRVDMFGALIFTTGADTTNLLSFPAGYIPAGAYTNQFIGSSVSSKGTGVTFYTDVSFPGRLAIPFGYATKSLINNEYVPLVGSWYVS